VRVGVDQQRGIGKAERHALGSGIEPERAPRRRRAVPACRSVSLSCQRATRVSQAVGSGARADRRTPRCIRGRAGMTRHALRDRELSLVGGGCVAQVVEPRRADSRPSGEVERSVYTSAGSSARCARDDARPIEREPSSPDGASARTPRRFDRPCAASASERARDRSGSPRAGTPAPESAQT
jgi:hypothetical protein